ncbi:MAG TPA: nickel-responsive transcriptional regulator NikR [Candidatus Hydrogenedentes bacterium]|nr:nickel-responsive transcriptional regulator NikR [Candidatus Hydrogenedentota bacterium]
MSDLVRMSITMEKELHDRLEEVLKTGPAVSRSEFIRDLVRERLARDAWKNNEEAVGTITVVYDHEVRELTQKLTHLQHHYHDAILATTHVHLTEELCAEMIMVRGRASEIEALAEGMRAHKGVLHAAVSIGSTGKRLAARRPRRHTHPH